MTSILAEPTKGQTYRISFSDIDGDTLSTAEGHITTVVLIGKANVDKAHLVGDRTPDFCLGNADYRMVTVVTFEAKHSRLVRAFMTSVMRHRVDTARLWGMSSNLLLTIHKGEAAGGDNT